MYRLKLCYLIVSILVLSAVVLGGFSCAKPPAPAPAAKPTPAPGPAPTATGVPTIPPGAQPIKLVFSGGLPVAHSGTKGMELMSKRAKELSNGLITIEVFPAAKLYKDSETVNVIPTGALDMALASYSFWTGVVPAAEVKAFFGGPDTYEKAFRFTELLTPIFDRESQKLVNTKFLGNLQYGTASAIAARKAIKTRADLKGVKIRVMSAVAQMCFEALGATPVQISVSEVYTALQQGTLDAGFSGISRIMESKWYEVARYVTIPPGEAFLSYNYQQVVINLDKWKSLPDWAQKILIQVTNEADMWTRPKVIEEDRAETKKAIDMGIVYRISEEDWPKWVEITTKASGDYLMKQAGAVGNEIMAVMEKAMAGK